MYLLDNSEQLDKVGNWKAQHYLMEHSSFWQQTIKSNQDWELTLNIEDKYLLIMALIIGSVTRVVSSVVLVEVSDSESVVGTVEWGYQVLVTWF